MGPANVISRLLVTSHGAPSNSRIMGFRKCGSFINVKFAKDQRGHHGSTILAIGKRPASGLRCMREERIERKGKDDKEEER